MSTYQDGDIVKSGLIHYVVLGNYLIAYGGKKVNFGKHCGKYRHDAYSLEESKPYIEDTGDSTADIPSGELVEEVLSDDYEVTAFYSDHSIGYES